MFTKKKKRVTNKNGSLRIHSLARLDDVLLCIYARDYELFQPKIFKSIFINQPYKHKMSTIFKLDYLYLNAAKQFRINLDFALHFSGHSHYINRTV